MKILVCGGAGFIGTNLVKELLRGENQVYIVDNLSTGRLSNIQDLINDERVSFFEYDIVDGLPKAIDNVKFDQIYNFASPASPPYIVKHQIETIKTNIYGVHNLLDRAVRDGARFLQSSTSEVYGSALQTPQKETYWGNVNPNGPRASYDESKRCAEALIYAYQREMNADVRIVRIFNTYGEYMKPEDGRVITNFITQALTNKDITIYGDGRFTRSFCYVGDLIRGILKLMNYENKLESPVNIGNDGEFTILELAYMVKELTNSQSKIVFMDSVQDDPPQRKPDLTNAKKILDYFPKVSLKEGLAKTIEYLKKEV